MRSILLLLLVSALLYSSLLHAEPWLANRYAQNCAACHSPARRNVSLMDRRCTLSCQGCHVNPNGGGIRNQYGVWLQERWLRSLVISGVGSHNIAPAREQRYGKQPKGGFGTDNPAGRRAAQLGFPLVETDIFTDEAEFDASDKEWRNVVQNRAEFLQRVTDVDPYRLERARRVTGGADLRYMYVLDQNSDPPADRKVKAWVMSADFGLRFRPLPEHLSGVLETRLLQAPGGSPDDLLEASPMVRSAYVLVDDLPFNTFLMHGYYRPMFGNMSADHTSLAQTMAGFSQRSVFRATTLGTAPNVPFFNVHVIEPHQDRDLDQSKGLGFNAGLRFVSFGASATASGWLVKDARTGLRRQLYAYDLGGQISRITTNFEILNFRNEIEAERFARGNVTSTETKLRAWRENYGVFNYAISNVAYDYRPGSVRELIYGLKSFPVAGTDLELYVVNRDTAFDATADAPARAIAKHIIQGQVHIFF